MYKSVAISDRLRKFISAEVVEMTTIRWHRHRFRCQKRWETWEMRPE